MNGCQSGRNMAPSLRPGQKPCWMFHWLSACLLKQTKKSILYVPITILPQGPLESVQHMTISIFRSSIEGMAIIRWDEKVLWLSALAEQFHLGRIPWLETKHHWAKIRNATQHLSWYWSGFEKHSVEITGNSVLSEFNCRIFWDMVVRNRMRTTATVTWFYWHTVAAYH